MSAGLVENHAAKAIFNCHSHDARRAVARSRHGHRLLCRAGANNFGIHSLKHFHTHPASGRKVPLLRLPILLGNGLGKEPGADLPVLRIQALGAGNEDIVIHVQQLTDDLHNGRIIVLCGVIRLLHDLDLLPIGNGAGDDSDRVNIPKAALVQHNVQGSFPLPQCFRRLPGAAQKSRFAGVHGRGHNASESLVHPDGSARHHRVLNGVHLPRNHVHIMIDGVFRKYLCIVRTGRHSLLQDALAYFS